MTLVAVVSDALGEVRRLAHHVAVIDLAQEMRDAVQAGAALVVETRRLTARQLGKRPRADRATGWVSAILAHIHLVLHEEVAAGQLRALREVLRSLLRDRRKFCQFCKELLTDKSS